MVNYEISNTTLYIYGKGLAAARTLLEKNPDMAEYLILEPTVLPSSNGAVRVEVQRTQYAGSSATFLLGALLSLCTSAPMDLSKCYVLELSNRRVFHDMIQAYMEA